MKPTYPSPDEACRASRARWAVSDPIRIQTPSHPTGVLVAVKYGDGSPYFVYDGSPGIRVHDARPTTGQVDAVKRWKSW